MSFHSLERRQPWSRAQQLISRKLEIRKYQFTCFLHLFFPKNKIFIDSVPWYGCYNVFMEKITIGKLAEMSGVGVETVRFYQRKKLLREPKATGAFRTYNEEDAQRITFITRAQDLGFTLSEVKELLELNTKPRMTCGTVKTKTEAKIQEIENKIADLNRMKASLSKLACACDASQDQVKQYKVQECFEIGLKCKC